MTEIIIGMAAAVAGMAAMWVLKTGPSDLAAVKAQLSAIDKRLSRMERQWDTWKTDR